MASDTSGAADQAALAVTLLHTALGLSEEEFRNCLQGSPPRPRRRSVKAPGGYAAVLLLLRRVRRRWCSLALRRLNR